MRRTLSWIFGLPLWVWSSGCVSALIAKTRATVAGRPDVPAHYITAAASYCIVFTVIVFVLVKVCRRNKVCHSDIDGRRRARRPWIG